MPLQLQFDKRVQDEIDILTNKFRDEINILTNKFRDEINIIMTVNNFNMKLTNTLHRHDMLETFANVEIALRLYLKVCHKLHRSDHSRS